MTEQPPLFVEPPWVDAWPVGTRVRSTFTGNTGEIVGHDRHGWRLTIKWGPSYRDPDGYRCFHSTELGLERLP